MKLVFTRKTWYFLLLAACAASMANGFAVLAGLEASLLERFAFLEMCAFCATGLAVLFLAAEKGAPKGQKSRYFGVFVLLLLSYILGGAPGYLCAALVWPVLLAVERGRGAPVERQLRLVGFAEAIHLGLLLAVLYGGLEGMRFFANLFWVLLAAARGWAALVLYKSREEA